MPQYMSHLFLVTCFFITQLFVFFCFSFLFSSKSSKVYRRESVVYYSLTASAIHVFFIIRNLAKGLQFWQKINGQTSKFARKLHFLGIRKVLNLGLKAEKPLQNENHTEDWALGSHPRDNGYVTH